MGKENKPRSVGRPKLDTTSKNVASRLPGPRYAQLMTAADKLERAPAWIIRRAVEEWLDRNGYPEKS